VSNNLDAVLSAGSLSRGVLGLDAVSTAPSFCVPASEAPDSTLTTPRSLHTAYEAKV